MRDRRFKAVHRGGLLNKEQHIQLMRWARICAENVLPLLKGRIDDRLSDALSVASKWEKGQATVGEARKASVECLKLARESNNTIEINISRATGHAVATAHMADHCLGAAIYALKALWLAGGSVEQVKEWQNDQLPEELSGFVISQRMIKEKHLLKF
jgi:hypothetical protein